GLGVGQVERDVPLRVDDDGAAGGPVADQVGRLGQAAQVVLPEDEVAAALPRTGLDGVRPMMPSRGI
ncbi:hypothetical protein WHI96_27720, partial [Pseudonocardia tropica]